MGRHGPGLAFGGLDDGGAAITRRVEPTGRAIQHRWVAIAARAGGAGADGDGSGHSDQVSVTKREARSEKREARSEKREARSEKREARRRRNGALMLFAFRFSLLAIQRPHDRASGRQRP